MPEANVPGTPRIFATLACKGSNHIASDWRYPKLYIGRAESITS